MELFLRLCLAIIRLRLQVLKKINMPYRYSLFVNGRHLGPYERRMIVGMRVKNIVEKNQLVQRNDGLDMTVAELLEDRLETKQLPSHHTDTNNLSRMGAPSSGMWPQFSVRFGGGPMKPGALGFNGAGLISYQGDELRFKGNRRNANLGMSRQEERLPLSHITGANVEGCFLQIHIKQAARDQLSEAVDQVRIEFVTSVQANELYELINLRATDMPAAHAEAPHQTDQQSI